ncbi:MAG: hypothetical protein AAF688_13000 [Bacteroidota bacterium]
MHRHQYPIFLFFFLVSIFTKAQEDINFLSPENRKGQLFFKVSSEYRITPLPTDSPKSRNVFVNTDLQNSGVAFAYTLDMFITQNLSIGFSNSFRYDYLGGTSDIEGFFGAEPSNRGIIIGYHFYLDYHFKIFRESEIFLRFGRSLLNRGTLIDSKETFFDEEGEPILTIGTSDDYAYEAYNWGLGWKKRKVEIMLAFYTSSVTEYFVEDQAYIIPYFKFSYNLGRL